MGNLNSLLQLITTCLILWGCTTEEINDTDLRQNVTKENSKNISNKINIPIVDSTKIIIEYPKYFTEEQKKKFRKKFQKNYGVIDTVITCDCSSKRIEKWRFEKAIDIEEEQVEITEDGIGVEYEFYYQNSYSPTGLTITNIEQDTALIKSNVVLTPSKITIATLDTGIDLNQLPNTGPFLYRLRTNESFCTENGKREISGWDFVNHDNNPHDDNGHGTIVTGIIKSGLALQKNNDFEILPVKVFDRNGEGSYFTLLCGYKYAVSKPDVSIINMSFGWYYKKGRILNRNISENDHILHITSAGNDSIDNDTNPHFPSSYRHTHIAAIGSIDSIKTKIADFSNYGTSSVDFLSLGDNISFYDINDREYKVSGTSFAAPFVTMKSALQYLDGHKNPLDILKQLRMNATPLGSGIDSLPVRCNDKIID